MKVFKIFSATCSRSSSFAESESNTHVSFQQIFSSAMEQDSKKIDSSDEISSQVESGRTSDCCEQTLTRSSSSASSSSAGCVFEGSEILGDDGALASPSQSCPGTSTLVDQTNWAEYLTLGVGEYNNCSHDDSGFRTETDESLCRTVSSCDLDFQEAGPAPRRPLELPTMHKPHTNPTKDVILPENSPRAGPVESSPCDQTPEISSQAPVVMVENLDTPSSTSSCEEALITNGQCSSTSHSCSSSRDSGLSSMAELESATASNTTPNTKNSSTTEIKSDKACSSEAPSSTACCSSSTGSQETQSSSTTVVHSCDGIAHIGTPIRTIPYSIGRVLEQDALAMPSASVMNRLRPPPHSGVVNGGCSSSQQFSLCSGSSCNSECSASLG